jgi:hypothetical protein
MLIFTTIFSQNDEMQIGWPLGLGFVNMRLRVVESLPTAQQVDPFSLSLHIPSTSFSSLSSSNLDTEVINILLFSLLVFNAFTHFIK